jgi:hypothetical protein
LLPIDPVQWRHIHIYSGFVVVGMKLFVRGLVAGVLPFEKLPILQFNRIHWDLYTGVCYFFMLVADFILTIQKKKMFPATKNNPHPINFHISTHVLFCDPGKTPILEYNVTHTQK